MEETKPQKVLRKIREHRDIVKPVAIAVGSVVAYTYVMNKFDYRMVKPAFQVEDRVVFSRPFGGMTAVKIDRK